MLRFDGLYCFAQGRVNSCLRFYEDGLVKKRSNLDISADVVFFEDVPEDYTPAAPSVDDRLAALEEALLDIL